MSDYTPEMAHDYAARGAAWLDRKCPGWEDRISLDVLNLADADMCVLGQTATCILGPEAYRRDEEGELYGYWRVHRAERWTVRGDEQVCLGFDVPHGGTFAEGDTRYEMLTIAWRQLIRERLAVPV